MDFSVKSTQLSWKNLNNLVNYFELTFRLLTLKFLIHLFKSKPHRLYFSSSINKIARQVCEFVLLDFQLV